MATLVLTSATTIVGTAWTGTAPGPSNPTVAGTVTTNLLASSAPRQVTLNNTIAMQDFTTFGDGAFVSQKPGLKSADIVIDYNQDFAASDVDAVYGAAFLAGTLMYLDFKGTSSARGATNPSYVYAAYVSDYSPRSNAVGDRAGVTVSFKVTGTYARLTS